MPAIDFIADTSALVRRVRKDPAMEPFFAGQRYATTFVTLAELGVGVLKARSPTAAWKQVLETLSGAGMFLASDLTPMIYAGVYRDLEKQGRRIPLDDIWIAALCLGSGSPPTRTRCTLWLGSWSSGNQLLIIAA